MFPVITTCTPDLLYQLGVKHMLVGHWHYACVFSAREITWHVAPATSWLPWGGELDLALHHIAQDGDVDTEFLRIPGALP